MNTIGQKTRVAHFQGEEEYMHWQNLIEDKAGVKCTVVVKGGCISIRTKDYADYVMARAVIRQGTSKEISRDIEVLA
jgi:hypothetical protein